MNPKETLARALLLFLLALMGPNSLSAQDTSLRIIAQPRLEGSFEGEAFLRVVAMGSTPISYQWFKDGLVVPGETADILRFSPLTSADAGTYCVKLVSSDGTLASDLVVIPRPPGVRLRSRTFHGPGDSMLRLIGDRLNEVDMVLLNGLSAVFQTVSDAELTVWIPNGLVNGPIQFRVGGQWLKTPAEFDLQLPGGLVLAPATAPSGSLYPVFTNAMAAVDNGLWILDSHGVIWSEVNGAPGRFAPLPQRGALAEKKWIGLSSHPSRTAERWLTLSSEGILYDRAGNTSRLERPIVHFATTLNGGIALDQAGEVWTFGALDNKVAKPQRVNGFGTNLTGLKAISKVIAGASYNFALNRAGQVYRWSPNSTTAQLLIFNQIGQAAHESLIDWIPDESDTGNGIRADGTVFVSRSLPASFTRAGLALDRVEGGIQQLLIASQSRVGFLAKSGLVCLPSHPLLGANAVGDYSGSVFRVLELHALARPRPHLGRSPLPLLPSLESKTPVEVKPSGHGPFRIQWTKNGLPLEGETNTLLSEANRVILANNRGNVDRYTVRVSNPFGTTESAPLAWIDYKPQLRTVEPTQGPPGTLVTVKGSGLKHLTSVTIGELAAAFRIVTDSEVHVRIPNGASEGFLQANAYSYRSSPGLRFKVIPGGNAAFAWGERNPELPFSAEYIPTNRTDSVAAYAGWRMSALRSSKSILEVWGQDIGHRFLKDATAIASLRSKKIYAYIQSGRVQMLPNPNGLPVPGFQPPTHSGFISLAGSADAFFALNEDNSITSWPPTDWATPPFNPRSSPPFHAISITAGADFAAALGRDGSVRAWGKPGAIPIIPPNLPCITAISASRLSLLALDVEGRVWELTQPNRETPLGLTTKPTPWMIRECVDIVAGDSGGFAQLQDGRRFKWELGGRNTPFHIASKEPGAVVARGGAHGIGLFRNSIDVRHMPPASLSVLEGTPLHVHLDVLGSQTLGTSWYRELNGAMNPVSSSPSLDFQAFENSDSGIYTFVVEDPFGARWSRNVALLSFPEPAIQVIESGPNSPWRIQIQSAVIQQFPFNQSPKSRWRLESAPTVEGPWKKMEFTAEGILGDIVTYTPKSTPSPTQFFRVVYDPDGL